MSLFVTYIAKPNEAPRGVLRGCCCGAAAAGLLLCPYRGGAAAAGLLLRVRAKRSGAGGQRPSNGERQTDNGQRADGQTDNG